MQPPGEAPKCSVTGGKCSVTGGKRRYRTRAIGRKASSRWPEMKCLRSTDQSEKTRSGLLSHFHRSCVIERRRNPSRPFASWTPDMTEWRVLAKTHGRKPSITPEICLAIHLRCNKIVMI
jgi:hypothetical protein